MRSFDRVLCVAAADTRGGDVVVAIVDLFDFHGSLVPDLPLVVGAENDLILVGNKIDLLPARVNGGSVERWCGRKPARQASCTRCI